MKFGSVFWQSVDLVLVVSVVMFSEFLYLDDVMVCGCCQIFLCQWNEW